MTTTATPIDDAVEHLTDVLGQCSTRTMFTVADVQALSDFVAPKVDESSAAIMLTALNVHGTDTTYIGASRVADMILDVLINIDRSRIDHSLDCAEPDELVTFTAEP